jgi:hypothetical protein
MYRSGDAVQAVLQSPSHPSSERLLCQQKSNAVSINMNNSNPYQPPESDASRRSGISVGRIIGAVFVIIGGVLGSIIAGATTCTVTAIGIDSSRGSRAFEIGIVVGGIVAIVLAGLSIFVAVKIMTSSSSQKNKFKPPQAENE